MLTVRMRKSTINHLFKGRLVVFFLFAYFAVYGQSQEDLSVEVSVEAGFYDGSIELELSSSNPKARIFYTVDGSLPTSNSQLYQSAIQLEKTKVIRAFALYKNQASKVATHTYFINDASKFPVVSVSISSYLLFDPVRGLFNKGPKASPHFPHYGANFWSRREYPCHFEFFETDGKRVVSDTKGFSIFGGLSRLFPQKSFSIVGRKRYGKKYIKHPIFPNRAAKKYKHFVLRNGGSDFNLTHLRDAVLTSLAEDVGFEVQAYRPCLVYLNGMYWGVYDLREKLNRYFVENHFGVDHDSIDLLEHRQDVKHGSIRHYNKLRTFLRDPSTNLALPEHFAKVDSMMDVQNFLTYEVFQIYIDNQDAGGNIKFWRPQTPNGKWKWVLYDTDFGFGMGEKDAYNNNSIEFFTEPNGPEWPNPSWSTLNLRKLLENQQFKESFAQRFYDLMNTVMKPNYAIRKIDSLKQQLDPEIKRHLTRYKMSYNYWSNQLEIMREFARQRPAYMKQYLKNYLGTPNAEELNLKLEATDKGLLVLNNFIKLDNNYFEGQYLKNLPIYLEAKPKFGYYFSHWSGQNGSKNNPLVLQTNQTEVHLKAHFEKHDQRFIHQIVPTEIGLKHPALGPWIELYNASNISHSLQNWQLFTNSTHYKLPATNLGPNEYLVITRDSQLFRKQYPSPLFKLVQIANFNLNPAQIHLQMSTPDNLPVFDLNLSKEPSENPYVIALNSPDSVSVPAAWQKLDDLGTPGLTNSNTLVAEKPWKTFFKWLILITCFVIVGWLLFRDNLNKTS